MIKRVVAFIAFSVTLSALIFLVGAFTTLHVDFRNWSQEGRGLAVTMWVGFNVVGFLSIFAEYLGIRRD